VGARSWSARALDARARRRAGGRGVQGAILSKRYLLADSTIDQADLDELAEWLRGTPWLTLGPLTLQFEDAFARWLGVSHAVFVNSGSSANLIAFYAALVSGRLKNRKVVVPSIAWATTVAPAIQLGFEPIMCEADARTFGVDVNHLEDLCRRHEPGAVAIVHVLGVPVDLAGVQALRDRFGFMLIEDSCAAMGSRFDRRYVGTFGEMSTFSFYFGHHLSTIEGGMVCTNDEALRDLLLQLRSHGWPKNLSGEKEARLAQQHGVLSFNRRFAFYQPGFNVRSSDLNARLGLGQMRKVEHVVARRIENHAVYASRFKPAEHFQCPDNPRGTVCSISFAALASSLEHRDRVGAVLADHEIETRPIGGGNMGRQPFWTERYGTHAFAVADRIHERGFMLPNHPVSDVNHICDIVLGTP
jgi:CDP-6-deoxy-D-xylo-4-hexulose-3-dehydrase